MLWSWIGDLTMYQRPFYRMWMVCALVCRELKLTVWVMWRPCEVDVRCHQTSVGWTRCSVVLILASNGVGGIKQYKIVFLDAFAKLRKATISFVTCPYVCLSVCPHGKTRLPLDGFARNLIFNCISNFCPEKVKVQLKSDTNKRHSICRPTCMYTCNTVCLSVWMLLIIRYVWDKSCTENQNTHFVFSNFFSKIVPFMR